MQPSQTSKTISEIARTCLLTRTRRISRLITNIYDQALRQHGINSPQFSLLVLIARLNGASRAEIGRANSQERSTMTRNLQLLLSQGWVREELGGAGRSRPIVLSDAGQELLVAAAPSWRAAQVKAKQLLGESGVATIVGVADGSPCSSADE